MVATKKVEHTCLVHSPAQLYVSQPFRMGHQCVFCAALCTSSRKTGSACGQDGSADSATNNSSTCHIPLSAPAHYHPPELSRTLELCAALLSSSRHSSACARSCTVTVACLPVRVCMNHIHRMSPRNLRKISQIPTQSSNLAHQPHEQGSSMQQQQSLRTCVRHVRRD